MKPEFRISLANKTAYKGHFISFFMSAKSGIICYSQVVHKFFNP